MTLVQRQTQQCTLTLNCLRSCVVLCAQRSGSRKGRGFRASSAVRSVTLSWTSPSLSCSFSQEATYVRAGLGTDCLRQRSSQ